MRHGFELYRAAAVYRDCGEEDDKTPVLMPTLLIILAEIQPRRPY